MRVNQEEFTVWHDKAVDDSMGSVSIGQCWDDQQYRINALRSKMIELIKENEELKEFKWKYEELCK